MTRANILYITLLTLIASLLTACGDSNRFVVEGEVAGNATMNIRLVYAAEGRLNNVLTASRDGKFEFTGSAPQGAVVEILDNNYKPLCRFYAHNGDRDISVYVDPRNPFDSRIGGNDINDAWQQWNTANAKVMKSRDRRAVNAAVARYVKANPDNLLSAILLTSLYDPRLTPGEGSRLMAAIQPAARPSWLTDYQSLLLDNRGEAMKIKLLPLPYLSSADSTATFDPKTHKRSLLAFTNDHCGRGDSVLPQVKKLSRRKDIGVIDFWLDPDTLTWRRSLRADSVSWPTAWAAGSVAAPGIDRLRIPSLPYFIVCDRSGRQLYRGSSVTEAVRALDDKAVQNKKP